MSLEVSLLTSLPGPLSEDRGPDPHQRGPLLDGDLKVIAHPHREVSEMTTLVGINRLISQFPKPPKERPNLSRIRKSRWDGHQAFDGQVGTRAAALKQGEEVTLWDAGLSRLLSQIDLYENPHLFSDSRCIPVKGCSQLERVDGMDEVEQLDRKLALVRLQVADHVPLHER